MKINLTEKSCSPDLWPLASTYSVGDIRLGLFTLLEKWKRFSSLEVTINQEEKSEDTLLVPVQTLPLRNKLLEVQKADISLDEITLPFRYAWDMLQLLSIAIKDDFSYLQTVSNSAVIPSGVLVIESQNVYIDATAKLYPCIINAENGPVIIGKNATVMEGSLIRGPFVLGEGSVVKMGTQIYGPVTIGKNCVVGGEIKNSLISDYSNKAHDGYLGDSVIGRWCNLGAGTTCSNVKNTAGDIYYKHKSHTIPVAVGKKAGLVMGDYSRSAIQTKFNTGSIVGVCCNVIHSAFPPTYIGDFRWQEDSYEFDKAILHIEQWKNFKQERITEQERTKLLELYKKII